jgi:signal transduction histidine kinase
LQEALNNVAKHSGADRVNLSLKQRNRMIELTIQDNGRGFDPDEMLSVESSQRGLGLVSMRERTELSDGSFSIESDRKKGDSCAGEVENVRVRKIEVKVKGKSKGKNEK